VGNGREVKNIMTVENIYMHEAVNEKRTKTPTTFSCHGMANRLNNLNEVQ
jgi:hypothetical protein